MSGLFDFGDESDDPPPLEGDDNTDDDNGEVPDETQPRHYNIIPQDSGGDVIFECKDKTTFLVSSAVLRLGSDYFKVLFDGAFKEAQATRSAMNPQEIELGEENSSALHYLFCLMHHQPNPNKDQNLEDLTLFYLRKDEARDRIASAVRSFRDLAVVVDFYGCSEYLSRALNSLLHEFAMPCIRSKMKFEATVDLTSAAYKLNHPRYYRLFTKRLLTDHIEPLEDAKFAEGLPDITIGLRQQSKMAWDRLQEAVRKMSQSRCPVRNFLCSSAGTDRLFGQKLADCLLTPGTAWPMDRKDGIPLRRLLVGIYHLSGVQRVSWCTSHRVHIQENVGPDDFRALCRKIDSDYPHPHPGPYLGSCLNCQRDAENKIGWCECENNRKQYHYPSDEVSWVFGDSYLLGTGAAERDWPPSASRS